MSDCSTRFLFYYLSLDGNPDPTVSCLLLLLCVFFTFCQWQKRKRQKKNTRYFILSINFFSLLFWQSCGTMNLQLESFLKEKTDNLFFLLLLFFSIERPKWTSVSSRNSFVTNSVCVSRPLKQKLKTHSYKWLGNRTPHVDVYCMCWEYEAWWVRGFWGGLGLGASDTVGSFNPWLNFTE